MNINGIHGSRAPAGPTAHEPKHARSHSSVPPAPEAAAAKTHISGPGQLFSGLSQLSQQDPERFKEVAQQIAEELSTAAESSTGRASDLAQRLADRFGQAAETGDMSALQGNGERGGVGHHPHHHHHHHLGGGSEAVRSVLENALDLVHEALNAPPNAPATATPATDATAIPATEGTVTPATDATATPSPETSATPATPSPASDDEA
jgi:hypothetical protein